MGDNIYGDSPDEKVLAAKYAQQKSIPGYAALREQCQVIGTWDDHDYGVNNGGKEFSAKEASQGALLDFLDEPRQSPRRKQKGVYWAHEYGEGNRKTQVILLDVRYFRDRPGKEGADILGAAQWAWLEAQLAGSDAELQLIVSGIQVLHEDHKYEKWANFPLARTRLLNLAANKANGRVVFLSGDRHISEMAQLRHGSDATDLVEVTSSSLTHSWTSYPGEPNRHRIREVYSENNFGTIEIDWEQRAIELKIRDEDGLPQRSLKLSLGGAQ